MLLLATLADQPKKWSPRTGITALLAGACILGSSVLTYIALGDRAMTEKGILFFANVAGLIAVWVVLVGMIRRGTPAPSAE
jgi:hypothetical protein